MKVFEVIELGCYNCTPEVYTKVFATREGAKKEWERRVKSCLNDMPKSKKAQTNDSEKLYFEAYEEGSAPDWSCDIFVKEVEVND